MVLTFAAVCLVADEPSQPGKGGAARVASRSHQVDGDQQLYFGRFIKNSLPIRNTQWQPLQKSAAVAACSCASSTAFDLRF